MELTRRLCELQGIQPGQCKVTHLRDDLGPFRFKYNFVFHGLLHDATSLTGLISMALCFDEWRFCFYNTETL